MKKVILVLLTASTLISCATRERTVSGNQFKRMRVYEVKNGYKQSVVELRYIDTMYRKGDTIVLGQSKFIIE